MLVSPRSPLVRPELSPRHQRARQVFSSYNGPLGIVAAGGWTLTLAVALLALGHAGVLSSFMAVGPNGNAKFGGAPIDTWGRWTALMAYSALSQLIQSLVEGTVEPFVTNVIKDPSVRLPDYHLAQMIVGVQNAFLWVVGLFDILLYITMQAQFWIPAIIADLAVNAALVHRNMLEKRNLGGTEPEHDIGASCNV